MRKVFTVFLCTLVLASAYLPLQAAAAETKAIAKEVFADVTVTVNDTTAPATYSGGTDWPITTFYFFSADNNKLGGISGQAMSAIMNKYHVNNNGSWDAPGNDGDWSKWFADMFNEYRGLSEGDVKKAETDSFEDFRLEVVRLTNMEREKEGLPALEINQDMMDFAQIRAQEMSILYSHKRPNGEEKEYRGIYPLENGYKGPKTPEDAIKGWMNSSGHRGSIFNKNVYAIGVGCYKAPDGTVYWTQEFVW